MSDAGPGSTAPRLEPAAPGARVTPLELLYDLVYAFAFLNVADVTVSHLNPVALLKSLLVLALLWFAWTSFATLGNAFRADQGILPLIGFTTMAILFVAAVTTPEAFADSPPGLPGDLVFATCYFLIRGLQVLLFRYAVRPAYRRHWWRQAVPVVISTSLLIIAALLPQRLFEGHAEFIGRATLWVLAIVIEYGARALIPTEGLSIVSVGHWAERYAQIVLVAFGESIISLGSGPNLQAGLRLTWSVIGASALGISLIVALWWAYFDSLSVTAERVLHRSSGAARGTLARDAYAYLHFPMIVGIIMFALGLNRTLTLLADLTVPSTRDRLGTVDLAVLYGGVIVYLLALLGFQLRTVGRAGVLQIVTVGLLAALIPVAYRLPAFTALALLVAVVIGFVVALSIQDRRSGAELRQNQ